MAAGVPPLHLSLPELRSLPGGLAALIEGDAFKVLPQLPNNLARCCLTSPPYWGLRDYGQAGQLGLEPHPDVWLRNLVRLYRQVRRVLMDDGTLWLVVGDSYASGGRGGVGARSTLGGSRHNQNESRKAVGILGRKRPARYKRKDLMGLPWRLALALQRDGWWLRSDIIWMKPNASPESVRDRPARCHEYIFQLAKSARYLYDYEAMAEPLAAETRRRITQRTFKQQVGGPKDFQNLNPAPGNARPKSMRRALENLERRYTSGNKARKLDDAVGRPTSHLGRSIPWDDLNGKRAARDVWVIPTQPYPGAHFAVFPLKLARRCILASSAPGDIILDPMGGSGTTARAALDLGRRAVHIDLGYLELAAVRIGPALVYRIP